MDPSSNPNPESFPTENQEDTEPNQIDNHEGIEPIYVMTLELEQGKAEQIKIFSDSEPNELAYAFCKEHDLDYNAHEYLTEKIEVLLNQYKNNAEDNSQIEEVEDEHGLTESNNNSNNNLNEKKGKFVYRTYDVEDENNEKNDMGNIGNDENSLRYSENSSLRNQKNKILERNKKNNEDDEVVISEGTERKGGNDNKNDNLIQIDDENVNKELEEDDMENMNKNNNDIKENFIATSSNNLVSENSNYNNTSPNKTDNIHSEINNFLLKNQNEIEGKSDLNNIINNNQLSSNNNNTNTSSSNTKYKSKPIKVKKNSNLSENENNKLKQNQKKQKSNDFVPLSNKKHISNINNPNQNMTTNSSFSVQMNILNKCPSNYSEYIK